MWGSSPIAQTDHSIQLTDWNTTIDDPSSGMIGLVNQVGKKKLSPCPGRILSDVLVRCANKGFVHFVSDYEKKYISFLFV